MIIYLIAYWPFLTHKTATCQFFQNFLRNVRKQIVLPVYSEVVYIRDNPKWLFLSPGLSLNDVLKQIVLAVYSEVVYIRDIPKWLFLSPGLSLNDIRDFPCWFKTRRVR